MPDRVHSLSKIEVAAGNLYPTDCDHLPGKIQRAKAPVVFEKFWR